MGRWPVALSMYMALFSTNTLIGVTGWLSRPNGTVWIGLQTIGIILAAPVVIWLFPTVFMKLKITTAYEYLEKRFDLKVRSMGTVLFLGARIMWMATMAYSASLVSVQMLGWGTEQQRWVIALLGGLGTFFAFTGGMYAVIWTDVIQFFVFTFAIVSMVLLGVQLSGGLEGVITTGLAFGKLEMPPLFDPTTELSLSSGILLGFVGMLASSGADQVILQTYLTAKSEREAKAALWRNAIWLKPISLIFPCLGLIMFTYFHHHPEAAAAMRSPDDAFAVFVMNVLPAGVRGLMIVAVVSAVLTSLTSGITAVTAAIHTHAIQCWYRRSVTEPENLRLARRLIAAVGVAIIVFGFVVKELGEKNNILQILNIVMYPFSGVLLGVFLLGLLTRRTNGRGALIGALIGFLITICVPLLRVLVPSDSGIGASGVALAAMELGRISTFYFGFLGTLATMACGYLASLLSSSPPSDKWLGLTRWSLPVATISEEIEAKSWDLRGHS